MDSIDAARQHLQLFKHLWSLVDERFDAAKVLTPDGHAFVQTHAIKGSHPEFPTALNFLAAMPASTNGARANIFPSGPSPLFSVFLNVNYQQTRKSSLTSINDILGAELDKRVQNIVQDKYNESCLDSASPGGEGEGGKGKGKDKRQYAPPEVASCVLRSATAEEFFRRCSGDFQQIENECSVDPQLLGRHWFGVLVNLDEAYDLLPSSQSGIRGMGVFLSIVFFQI